LINIKIHRELATSNLKIHLQHNSLPLWWTKINIIIHHDNRIEWLENSRNSIGSTGHFVSVDSRVTILILSLDSDIHMISNEVLNFKMYARIMFMVLIYFF